MIKGPALFDAFENSCNENSPKNAIGFKQSDNYVWLTYGDLYNKVISFGGFLNKSGVKKNEPVVIILENNYYWPTAFFGVMRVGAYAVPLCAQSEPRELADLIAHCESRIIITSENIRSKLEHALRGVNVKFFCIDMIDFENKGSCDGLSPYESASGEEIASIVYTSGTTAIPKGVILTHSNLISNAQAIYGLNLIKPDDNVISLLPLHHTYPFMVNILIPLFTGSKISFPSNLNFEEITQCIEKTGVTIFVAVPRIYSLFSDRISATLKALPFFKKTLLEFLLGLSQNLRKKFNINLSKLIMRPLHKKIGENLRFMVSGGAKLNKNVAGNFYKWGFTILEGYGLTEASPVVSFNLPRDFKIGSVGKPLAGIDVKISEPDKDGIGEIIIKGPNITEGYYKDPAFTAETIKGGWFYTRDLGYFDKDGFLFISGRKTETIILSSGKKIDPEELETYYSSSPYIKEICIFLPKAAEEADLLTAVVLADLEYFRVQGVGQIKYKIRFEIENLSAKLAAYKRIKKYIIINEPLPRTLLGKLKRFEIENRYSGDLNSVEKDKVAKESLPGDQSLLSSTWGRKIIAHLSDKLRRPVKLDDHLELDLGLDSLERISLFFELQKILGRDLDEKEFFSVASVRDVLEKLQNLPGLNSHKEENLNWRDILFSSGRQMQNNIKIHFNALEKTTNFILMGFLFAVSRCFFLLTVKGRQNIPRQGPYIFCPNHGSFLDPPLFSASLPRHVLLQTYILGYSAYINHPLLSWAKKLCRLIPLDPASKLTDSLSACSYVLNNSKVLCIFPEGGRSIDGEIKEFKRGVGIFIKELNVPVIPVYIRGAHGAWPPGKKFPRPGKVKITFGRKITVDELTASVKHNIDIYQNIADNLRQELIRLKQSSELI